MDELGGFEGEHFLVGVAMHSAEGGIGFDEVAPEVVDGDSVGGSLKDGAVLLLFLSVTLFVYQFSSFALILLE